MSKQKTERAAALVAGISSASDIICRYEGVVSGNQYGDALSVEVRAHTVTDGLTRWDTVGQLYAYPDGRIEGGCRAPHGSADNAARRAWRGAAP